MLIEVPTHHINVAWWRALFETHMPDNARRFYHYHIFTDEHPLTDKPTKERAQTNRLALIATAFVKLNVTALVLLVPLYFWISSYFNQSSAYQAEETPVRFGKAKPGLDKAGMIDMTTETTDDAILKEFQISPLNRGETGFSSQALDFIKNHAVQVGLGSLGVLTYLHTSKRPTYLPEAPETLTHPTESNVTTVDKTMVPTIIERASCPSTNKGSPAHTETAESTTSKLFLWLGIILLTSVICGMICFLSAKTKTQNQEQDV